MIFLFNRTILRCIGQDGLVSYTIIAYINTLILNIMLGVSQGSQPLVSYHYGQRDRKGCRRLLQYGLVTLAGMTVLCFGSGAAASPRRSSTSSWATTTPLSATCPWVLCGGTACAICWLASTC